MSAELRITDTNSVNDSKGRALGLEGNDFLYVIGGFVAAFACYLLLDVLLGAATLPSILLALPILVLPTAWVLLCCECRQSTPRNRFGVSQFCPRFGQVVRRRVVRPAEERSDEGEGPNAKVERRRRASPPRTP